MVFHEITPEAIAQAVANPREIDEGLVDAYETRRVLDRLYGYEVSPVLWKKVMPRLSAGRVQSVATRLVVDRERERIAFRTAQYWDLEAAFAPADAEARRRGRRSSFPRRWSSVDGSGSRRAATSPDGRAARRGHAAPGRGAAAALAARWPARRSRCAGGAQALPPFAVRAVPHHDAAAGGLAQARLLGQVHDVGGAAAVRERLHHLYADRLDHAVRRPRSTPPARRPASCTAPTTSRTSRAPTPAR